MTTRSQTIPSFLGGISNQPELYRTANAVTDAENMSFSASDGAGRRYPTTHVAEVAASALTDAYMVSLERDEEDYRIILLDGEVVVVTAAGAPVDVLDISNGPGFAPDFSYLDDADFFSIRDMTVADSVFVLNREVAVVGGAGQEAPTWTEPGEAGVFIRQANYGVRYAITIEPNILGGPVTVEYIVPDAKVLAVIDPAGGSAFTTVATANQAAGIDPFIPAFDANQADDLRPTINATPAPTSDWTWDPVSREAFYTGSGIIAGDTVNLGRTTTTLNWVLRTDLIARILREQLAAITGVTVETLEGASSFRVFATSPLDRFEASDSVGNTYLTGWTNTVTELSDLPLTFKHGAVVKVRNDTASTIDDYYVVFASEEWQRLGGDFDSYSGFGSGTWLETTARDLDTGAIDATTMPHVLRRMVDTAGTYTGMVDEVFFDWQPFDGWRSREAGDEETNPEPSFVGRQINDIFLHQGRLGLLSGSSVNLSDSGDVGQFWASTLLSVPDSDAIDVDVTTLNGDTIWNAVPFDRQLLVFSDRAQATLIGDPILSKSTVQSFPLSQFEAFASVRPVYTGRSLFFGWPNRSYTGVREFVPGNDIGAFNDFEITIGAHRLIPKEVRRLAASSSESSVAILDDDGGLFVYRYLRTGGELILSSWARWTFNDGIILDVTFDQESLDLLIVRGGTTCLERIDLGSGQVDEDLDFVIYADRKAPLTGGVYDIAEDNTAYFAPWELTGTDLLAYRPGNGEAEIVVSQDTGSGVVRLAGDTSAVTVWLGESYNSKLVLSRPVYRRQTQAGSTPSVGEIQIVRALKVAVTRTGYIKATTEYPDGQVSEEELLTDFLNVDQLVVGDIHTDELFVGIHAPVNEFRVTLNNDTHLPFFLVSGEWDVLVNAKHVKA